MIRRSTWILLAIFGVLVLAAVLWKRYKPETEIDVPTPVAQAVQPALYDLSSAGVLRIQIIDADGNEMVIERGSTADSWIIAGESEETSDTFKIGSLAGQLFALQAMTTFQIPLETSAVGLNNPAYTITMRTDSGDEIVTKIGDLTAIGSGYYVQVDEGDVVVVDQVSLDPVLDMLENPPLMPTPTAEISETITPDPESTAIP